MDKKPNQPEYGRLSPLDDMYISEEQVAPEARRKHFRLGRFLSGLILLLPAGMALSNVPSTLSFFEDTAGSVGNFFGAAPLDFILDADAPMVIALSVGEGEENGDTFAPFVIPEPDSIDFEYYIRAEYTGGDFTFCSALQLYGTPPLFEYNHLPLLSLVTATTTDVAPWSLLLYLPPDSGVIDGALCFVDLVYAGFQEGGQEGQEYHDEERLSLMITAATAPAIQQAFFLAPLEENGDEPLVEEPPLEEEPVVEEEIPPSSEEETPPVPEEEPPIELEPEEEPEEEPVEDSEEPPAEE